jgi:hypothetical protein
MKRLILFLLSSSIISSCTSAAQPASQTEVINVYATSAAQPWLTELYACAEIFPVVLRVNADKPDIYLQVGEPNDIVSPVYQIDDEEILIVTNRESPVQNLSLQDLFAQGDSSAQVWVYSSDMDVQIVFDQLVMKGGSVTSSARVAVSAQIMSDVLNSETNAVGILPRHWKTGNVRDVFSVGNVPVLALTNGEPQGVMIELLACLQNN